jgi:hypothetical protein
MYKRADEESFIVDFVQPKLGQYLVGKVVVYYNLIARVKALAEELHSKSYYRYIKKEVT